MNEFLIEYEKIFVDGRRFDEINESPRKSLESGWLGGQKEQPGTKMLRRHLMFRCSIVVMNLPPIHPKKSKNRPENPRTK